jgi:hypothetical protein
MESKLANEAKLALLAAARRLTPEQRLNAFLAHCQLMMELHAAGQKLRSVREKPRTCDAAETLTSCLEIEERPHVLGNCTN